MPLASEPQAAVDRRLRWQSCSDGAVPFCAVLGGWERGADAATYIGRFALPPRCQHPHVGRVVPSKRSCFAICHAMEHKRSRYEVLVSPSGADNVMWVRDGGGHIPDNAIAFRRDGEIDHDGSQVAQDERLARQKRDKPTTKKKTKMDRAEDFNSFYIGRAQVQKGTVVPGRIIPSHGAIHAGFSDVEIVKEEYEVLCWKQPCSLKYLAGKKIRQQITERERWHNAKYSTRLTNAMQAIESFFCTVFKKPARPRGPPPPETRLDLPLTLSSYLRSPRDPRLDPRRLQRTSIDFGDILSNCCPPEENCCCQSWIEVTLSGLY